MSRHEQIWKGVPEGVEPSDFKLRSAFLLGAVKAGQRVLDVGCGDGAFVAKLAAVGCEVVGIEVAREPLRRARALYPELLLMMDLRLVAEDGEWEGLEDASFDVVWAGEVIEHVLDTAAWLSEVRRVLRSDGRLLLSTPAHGRLQLLRLALSRRAFAEHFDPLGDHLRFYSPETLTALLEQFRFGDVRVRRAGGVLLASASRLRF